MSEISRSVHTSTPNPAATSHEFWLKAVVGFGLFATAAWTGLVGYGFLKLVGLHW